MGILRRLRERGEALIARNLRGELRALTAEIPGSHGPLWQLRVELDSEPRAGGEQLRIRAQLRLCLRRPRRGSEPQSPDPRALTAGTATGNTRNLAPAVGRWIEKRMESPLMQSLAAPLLDRDICSWIELRASDAALDEGSRALVPERLNALGIEPQPGQPVQTWAGPLTGPRSGFAVLTLLQLDKDRLPQPLQQQLGSKPFQLAAAIASMVEEAQTTDG